MDTSEVLVLVGGVILIALTLWYFFGERTKAEARAGASGVQEVDITVKGGYSPDTVVVKQGVPGPAQLPPGGNVVLFRAGRVR